MNAILEQEGMGILDKKTRKGDIFVIEETQRGMPK
jgi:hypothetical protein